MGLFGNLKSLFDKQLTVQTRYELLREAISGTMSNFYMARDRETGKGEAAAGMEGFSHCGDRLAERRNSVEAAKPLVNNLFRSILRG